MRKQLLRLAARILRPVIREALEQELAPVRSLLQEMSQAQEILGLGNQLWSPCGHRHRDIKRLLSSRIYGPFAPLLQFADQVSLEARMLRFERVDLRYPSSAG